MINLTILLVVLILSIIFLNDKYDDLRFLPFLMLICSSVFILIHLIAWLTTPIEFNAFKAKHEQLKIDLEISRTYTESYERMAILQEITMHNQIIAENKQLNKNWFMDQYIDDRVESLETIK